MYNLAPNMKTVLHQPSIYIADLRIDEPVTVLTDLLVSVVCIYAFWGLKQKSGRDISLFKNYFLSMAVATFLGGIIGHGFMYALPFEFKLPGWVVSMFSIAFLERAVIVRSAKVFNQKWSVRLLWFNGIELCVFMFLTFYFLDFKFVEIHSGYGIVGVTLSLSLWNYIKLKSAWTKQFFIAIAFSGLAALVFSFKISLGEWFNHLDISHVFMAASAYFFYRGAKLND